jgi:hypothetical protein
VVIFPSGRTTKKVGACTIIISAIATAAVATTTIGARSFGYEQFLSVTRRPLIVAIARECFNGKVGT